MAARLTPDQKVGSSNLSAVIFPMLETHITQLPRSRCIQHGKRERLHDFPTWECKSHPKRTKPVEVTSSFVY